MIYIPFVDTNITYLIDFLKLKKYIFNCLKTRNKDYHNNNIINNVNLKVFNTRV